MLDYQQVIHKLMHVHHHFIKETSHMKLVGGIPTPLKNMSSWVGMMKFPTEWKVIKFMFQTTNEESV